MSSKIDYNEINRLIKLMEKKNLSHFEIEVEGLKIKISKNTSSPEAKPLPAVQPSLPSEERRGSEPRESPPEKKKDDLHYILSPMVGTFFRAPDPSSSPFVEVGDKVKTNQVLCIIEAMKLMNEIESDVEGILKEVYVESGKPIEYGQKLFAIQPF